MKSENEHGYYIVDAINEAIDTKRKISFYYTDFDIAKQRYVTNDGNPYTVSPYTLIRDGDYYYMRGFCDERQEMRNFRLDRIAEQPKILNQIVVMPPEDYTPADYSKHVFRMYDTEEPVKVQLYCHVSVMKYLIDNFGTEFECGPVDAEYFKATVSVCTSTTFYRWVFGFNGKIKIVGLCINRSESSICTDFSATVQVAELLRFMHLFTEFFSYSRQKDAAAPMIS